MTDSYDIGRLTNSVSVTGNTYMLSDGKISGYGGVFLRLAYGSGDYVQSLGDKGYVMFRVIKVDDNVISYKDYSLYCSDESNALLKGIGGSDNNGISCVLGFETDVAGRKNCNVYLLSDGADLKYAYQILYCTYLGAIDACYNIHFFTPVGSIPNKQAES